MALEVIGAGLGRTGTMSLKVAIERLGIGRCYHMSEVFAAGSAAPLWVDAADGRPDWERIFDGFAATMDYPGCTFWRELARAYPQAKVILSLRDPESWFESVNATIMSPPMIERTRSGPMAEFFERIVFGAFGERIADRDFMIDRFRAWNQSVIDACPPERLLVFEARQGWEPLCAFLGRPVPDTPYPRANRREDLEERIGSMTDNASPGQVAAAARAFIEASHKR